MNGGHRVVVVGGGVVGTACAHYLRQRDYEVTVIDQGVPGQACSQGNCGLVCPSHVLPLAEPGAVRHAWHALLHPSGPFAIKPRWDPALWVWLIRFALRCNRRDMLRAASGLHALLQSSRTLYDQLLEQESLSCEWEQKGLLFAYRDAGALRDYAPTASLLRDHFQLEVAEYDCDAVHQLEPALTDQVAGGWYFPQDAHLRPDRLMTSWQQVLKSRGVAFRSRCGLQDLDESGSEVRVHTTDGEVLVADEVVVATGAWTPRLKRQLGIRVPIQPGKGYSVTMPRPTLCPRIPMIFPECKVAVTPMHSGYRIGSTMEFAGYDTRINARRLQLLFDGAARFIQDAPSGPVQETWYGWRPMTHHGLPIIGRCPRLDHVWIAAGHGMLGLSMAPATGKLISELISGSEPHVKAQSFQLGGV